MRLFKPTRDHARHWLHHAHPAAHCAYFGAVAWEAHGTYGLIAGLLLALTVTQILLGEDVP